MAASMRVRSAFSWEMIFGMFTFGLAVNYWIVYLRRISQTNHASLAERSVEWEYFRCVFDLGMVGIASVGLAVAFAVSDLMRSISSQRIRQAF